MAFGNKQNRVDKQAAKQADALDKKGLDIDNYTDEELRARNAQDIADVNSKLVGSGLYSFGSLLSGNSDTSFMLSVLKAQLSQNWIVVRQNEQIIRQNQQIIDLLSKQQDR